MQRQGGGKGRETDYYLNQGLEEEQEKRERERARR